MSHQLQPAADVPLLISSSNASSERRITPSWTIAFLKTRLEPITGIPGGSQQLTLRVGSQDAIPITAADEENTQLSVFPLQPYAEITVTDTRPVGARTDFNDLSSVEKYVMPTTEYESRTDSVLAWKKAQKLGRFDPNAGTIEEQKIRAFEREIEERGITLNSRVRLLPATDARRGTVSYIGPVPEIPGGVGAWIGVTLDEPTGKNDGSVVGKRYFTCGEKCGVFVRPERCEVGDWAELGLEGSGDEEEI